MTKSVSMIGIEPSELRWIHMLISLLRHSDPGIPELARQAVLYLTEAAGKRCLPPGPSDQQVVNPGLRENQHHRSRNLV